MNTTHKALLELLVSSLEHQLTKLEGDAAKEYIKERIAFFKSLITKISGESNYRLSVKEWKQAYLMGNRYYDALEQEYRMQDSFDPYHLATIAQMRDALWELVNE